MSTVKGADLLRAGIATLSEAGIEGAPGDARRLLAHALGIAPGRVSLALHDPVPEAAAARFDAAIAERCRFRPVAQITGQRQFWGRVFEVTRDTLDPRPETEELVAEALSRPFTRMLDMGTGTGCILLSCLADMPGAQGLGTDVSAPALAVARRNAQVLSLDGRATFRPSDWFADVTGQFDLIVSNPPYIAEDEMAHLSRDVREWEPHGALTPGGDGLAPYRLIAAGLMAHLAPGGRALFEIGPTQGAAVAGFLQGAGLSGVRVRRDMDGRDRVVIAERHG